MSNINYFKDKHALDVPWIESPFFYELLKNDTTLTEDPWITRLFMNP